MTDIPPPISYRLLQLAGPGLTSLLYGTAAVSLVAIPALQQVPANRVPAPFRWIHNIDHGLRQYLVMGSASALFLLSGHLYTLTRPVFVASLYKLAGAFTASNLTFTAYVLGPVARPLVAPSINPDENDDDSVIRDSLDAWGFWNALRADLTLGVAAILSLCAVLEFDVFAAVSKTAARWMSTVSFPFAVSVGFY